MDWSETRSTWSIPRMIDIFIGKLDYYHPLNFGRKNKWKENGYFEHEIARHIFCKTVLPALHDICREGWDNKLLSVLQLHSPSPLKFRPRASKAGQFPWSSPPGSSSYWPSSPDRHLLTSSTSRKLTLPLWLESKPKNRLAKSRVRLLSQK